MHLSEWFIAQVTDWMKDSALHHTLLSRDSSCKHPHLRTHSPSESWFFYHRMNVLLPLITVACVFLYTEGKVSKWLVRCISFHLPVPTALFLSFFFSFFSLFGVLFFSPLLCHISIAIDTGSGGGKYSIKKPQIHTDTHTKSDRS